jgi:hypothetical protein
MNRLLITLLALLTGLVAQTTPAAAALRSGGQTEIGALAVESGQHRNSVAIAGAEARESQSLPALVAPAPVASGAAQALLPPVLIGIDRARE